MRTSRWFVACAMAALLVCMAGCEGGDSGGGSGSYAGTWTGTVCGRGLTLTLNQNGTNLSGTYALTDPDFVEPVNGTVSSRTPPATVTLTAQGGRKFEMTFNSYSSMSGTFFNPGPVCQINAVK